MEMNITETGNDGSMKGSFEKKPKVPKSSSELDLGIDWV